MIGSVLAENIARSQSCRLVHVADSGGPKAEAPAGRVGAEDGAVSVETVLTDLRVQAVVIASSTSVPGEHVLEAARARKAILVEKPAAVSIAGARKCMRAIDAAGIVAAVGFNRRFDPSHRALFEAVGTD